MTLTTTQTEQIKKLAYDNLKMDLLYFVEQSEAEDIDELTDYLQDNGAFDIEIIYYHSAMEYLKENDASLQESLSLAHDLGFEINRLNSETLASLLASENEREAYHDIADEIEEILFDTPECNHCKNTADCSLTSCKAHCVEHENCEAHK